MNKKNEILAIAKATNDDLVYLLRISFMEISKVYKLELVQPVLNRIKAHLNNLVGSVQGMSNEELNFKIPILTKEEHILIDWLELTNANVIRIIESMNLNEK